MGKTKIEWTERTWSPITGCTPISEGCRNCYAERMARRLAGRYGYPKAPRHFDVTLHHNRLDEPLKRKKPTMYFVCSMSDLFHRKIHFGDIATIFDIMARTPQHTYQVLTKRPQNALRFFNWYTIDYGATSYEWPFDNVWLGVTAENQATADERIPILLQTPAAVRFVSCEPLLSEIDLSDLYCGLSWCVIGAESGPRARPMDENWVRRLVSQCRQYKIPVFYKQKIVNGKKVSMPMLDGQTYSEFPQITGRPNANS